MTAVALLLCAVASCADRPPAAADEFCVALSDSVGLYVGNPVTQMGYPIGTVKSIKPRSTDVEVGFSIDENRPIPDDVRAVIRSPSILADRSLELVGNYAGGPRLTADNCIPLNRSSTPLSISQVIGSATTFINGISPDGSTNLRDAVAGIDQAANGNGVPVNDLITRSSGLLDNPDQVIADLGQITRTTAELTDMLRANRVPLKEIVQAMPMTNAQVVTATEGAANLAHPLPEIIQLVNDLELDLGPEIQLALDEVGEQVRILSPHYKGIANMLNFLPRAISGLNGEPAGATAGGLAKHINNHVFGLLTWRPPLFRIPAPGGLFTCGVMNASMPGSCADIGGRPYAVDVSLLQYVLAEAARR